MARPRAEKNTASPKNPTAKAYFLTLELPDQTFKAQAPTIIEALQEISTEVPKYFKGKGIFTVKSGRMQSQLTMYPLPLRRLFINKVSQEIFQKRMAVALS